MLEGLFPGAWRKASVFPDQRLLQAVFVVDEIEAVTPFDAQEVAVHPALVAIVAANDFHAGIGAANSQSGFAAVAAVRAGRAHVLHLPGPGLVPVGTRGEGADRADV